MNFFFYGINAVGLLLREETVCWVFGLVRSKLTRG